MAKGIAHFMWGYQPHFRIGQELKAKGLFGSLDPSFEPEAFLVGIRTDNFDAGYPASVEPEEHFWLPSDTLNEVLSAAKDLASTYPESSLFHTGPGMQDAHLERLFRTAIMDATIQRVRAHPKRPKDMEYFASFPTRLGDHLIMLILGLQAAVIDSHPQLTTTKVPIHEFRSYHVATSLIDAAREEYFVDASEALRKPDPGADLGSGRSQDEILRTAGDRLMRGCALRADLHAAQMGAGWVLFQLLNRIASQKYERNAGIGTCILAAKSHPGIKREVEFLEPIPLSKSRGARKLLELASKGRILHIGAEQAFGLAVDQLEIPASEDLFRITFREHHEWELLFGSNVLMRVRAGQPHLPSPTFNEEKVVSDFKRVFKDAGEASSRNFLPLIHKAATEKKGTMLVICSDAHLEAARLGAQAIRLKPCRATPELIRHLTPIDGAVLLDPEGICHAVGVILDGQATAKGDPARGARYNSAARYVYGRQQATLVIVCSEDGGVDVLPALRPALRRSVIERCLSEMESLLAEQSFNRRRYHQLDKQLREKYAFYLLPEHCKKANELAIALSRRDKVENPDGFIVTDVELYPHPEFSAEKYYSSE